MPLAALFKRLTTSAGSSTTDLTNPNAARTATSASDLFPAVTESEAKECSHECHACPDYPRSFQKMGIDTDDELYGHIKGWATHAIVATGQTDWIRDVEEIKGSVMQALGKAVEAGKNKKKGRLMISASNLPVGDVNDHEHHEQVGDEGAEEEAKELDSDEEKKKQEMTKGKGKKTSVILLPSFTVAEGVCPDDAPAIVEYLNGGPTNMDPLSSTDSATDAATTTTITESAPVPAASSSSDPSSDPSSEPAAATDPVAVPTTTILTPSPSLPPHITHHPYPHQALILLCSHRHRDARCGISAPLLRKEFERHLRPLGLWRDHTDRRPGGVSVVFINHVGGHKYAANCIIYRKAEGKEEAAQGIWLARVAPKHVEAIVKYTVGMGKVLEPEKMLRGGFDRERGLVSW